MKGGRTKFELKLADAFDVRKRVDAGMEKLTFLQYFCYTVINCVIAGLAGQNLITNEKNVDCWSAESYDQQLLTTTRFKYNYMFLAPLILIFFYYIVDAARTLSVLLYIKGSKALGVGYVVLQLNEFVGLGAIGVNWYFTYSTFPSKLCSGDYSLFWKDGVYTQRGGFLKTMLYFMPIYIGVQMFLHILLGFLQARELETECKMPWCKWLFSNNKVKSKKKIDKYGKKITKREQLEQWKQKYRDGIGKPWAFFIYNVCTLLVMFVMHAVLIGLYNSYLYGNYLLYFIAIEIPSAIYAMLNIILLLTCKMEMYQKRMLRFRYCLIDFWAIGITAGFITMIVEYSIVKAKLDYSSTLSVIDQANYQTLRDVYWFYLWLLFFSMLEACGFVIYSKTLHYYYYPPSDN